MRFWFLTSTTYGTWLPGDERGFVSPVRQPVGPERRSNTVGAPFDADHRGLRESAEQLARDDAVWLTSTHANVIAEQFQETAEHRGWTLHAFSIASNHVHILVEVADDPDPSELLRSFKAYASRRLNKSFPRRETWWTSRGSTRKKSDDRSILEAIRYVRDQEQPLLVWLNPDSKYVQKLALFDQEFPKET